MPKSAEIAPPATGTAKTPRKRAPRRGDAKINAQSNPPARGRENPPAIAPPARVDLSDAEIAAAVRDAAGFPSAVMDALKISYADLLTRAKASPEIAAAFAETKQQQIDAVKRRALQFALGSADAPPDPLMIRWYVERYE